MYSILHCLSTVPDSVRDRALRLVKLAYSSIGADDFATFVGMPADKAIEGELSVHQFCLFNVGLLTIINSIKSILIIYRSFSVLLLRLSVLQARKESSHF